LPFGAVARAVGLAHGDVGAGEEQRAARAGERRAAVAPMSAFAAAGF
jgi:hypothetical protein